MFFFPKYLFLSSAFSNTFYSRPHVKESTYYIICLNFSDKLDDFYHLKYSDYCLHLYCRCALRSSSDVSYQTWEFHWTSKRTLYLIHGVDSSNPLHHERIQFLSYSQFSLLFTCNQERTCWWFHFVALFNQTPITVVPFVRQDNSESIFGTYKPNVSINS